VAEPDPRDERRRPPLDFDPEAAPLGRVALWLQRTRLARARVEAARERHVSVDLGLSVVERDASIGGGLLSGALAYRLFVLLLPTALLFVSGLGLYADAAHKSTRQAAREAGLQGLMASQVASTARGGGRWAVFLVMVPVALYAAARLYRAVAITHALAWHGSGRGVRTTPRGVGLLIVVLFLTVAAVELGSLLRRHSDFGDLIALAVYIALVGGGWLALSWRLPRRDVAWTALLPGAALAGVGLLFLNVFNVYVTTRLVEGRANTYGALGVAAALLFSLVLVGRVIVVSAELNAEIAARHDR
jgi:uncharacterized BrkB/YihY/UPF0761 family membrane protein